MNLKSLVKKELSQFVDDLLKFVGKIYGQLIDVVSEELFPLIHMVLFNPLEGEVLLDQYVTFARFQMTIELLSPSNEIKK